METYPRFNRYLVKLFLIAALCGGVFAFATNLWRVTNSASLSFSETPITNIPQFHTSPTIELYFENQPNCTYENLLTPTPKPTSLCITYTYGSNLASGNILVTGFEPFGGYSINSSWEAAKMLDGLIVSGARVHSVQLPVVWATAGQQLRHYIEVYRPILVLNVGQGGSIIELEQYAFNYNGPIRDNWGEMPGKDFIIQNAPQRIESMLDLERISNQLTAEGVEHSISGNAGDYLCNYIAYQSYFYLSTYYTETPAIFVHVPPISNTQETAKIHAIANALKVILVEAMIQVDE